MMRSFEKLLRDRMFCFSFLMVALILFFGVFARQLAPHSPKEVYIERKFSAPSLEYPLGTDQLGRCVYSRLIFGIRYTVFLSVFITGAIVLVGMFLGVFAGFFRGPLGELIMRVCDAALSLPSEVMVLAVIGILGPGISHLALAVIAARWPWYARMVWSAAIQITEEDYVQYARVCGGGGRWIILKHLLPGIAGEVGVLAALEVSSAILNVSAMSFLGLGVQPPTPEWGMMLNEAKTVMTIYPLQMFIPGFAIMMATVSFNFLGDSLQNALNPKYRIGE